MQITAALTHKLTKILDGFPTSTLIKLTTQIYPLQSSTSVFQAIACSLERYTVKGIDKGLTRESISKNLCLVIADLQERLGLSRVLTLQIFQEIVELICAKVQPIANSDIVGTASVSNTLHFINPSNSLCESIGGALTSLLKNQILAKMSVNECSEQSWKLPNIIEIQNENIIRDEKIMMNRKGNSTDLSEETRTRNDPSIEYCDKLQRPQINSQLTPFCRSNPHTTFKKPPPLSRSLYGGYLAQTTQIPNLNQELKCVCGKGCTQIAKENDGYFMCYHCKQYFHKICMKRDQNCLACFMELMLPLQRVKSQIFVRYLPKNRRKHQFYFEIDSFADIKANVDVIQIRCLKISQQYQNLYLFPNSFQIWFNDILINQPQQYQHQQKSLKLSSKQTLTIPYSIVRRLNKIFIREKLPRVHLQGYIIGVYIIQNLNVQQLANEFVMQNLSELGQSKAMLQSCFLSGSQQLKCEIVKIPLTCSLSTERIGIPARGVFCRHFHCFDLENYLTLIFESSNAKWLCPLCKQPAYQFVVDPILFEILKQSVQDNNLTHVIFKSDGSFQLQSNIGVYYDNNIQNVDDLFKESKIRHQNQAINESKQKFMKKVCKSIPLKVQIIKLQD